MLTGFKLRMLHLVTSMCSLGNENAHLTTYLKIYSLEKYFSNTALCYFYHKPVSSLVTRLVHSKCRWR